MPLPQAYAPAMAAARVSDHVSSGVDGYVHPHIRRRNCDAAVERSPALEFVDEQRALRFGDAVQRESQMH